MTKDELLKNFERLGIAPPGGASKEDLDRTYRETVRNIHQTRDHPLASKLTKEDSALAEELLTDAASYDQHTVDVGGTS